MGVWYDHIRTFWQTLLFGKHLMVITKELVSRRRPFAGRNEIQVFHAVTRGEVPSFTPSPNNEPSTIQDTLEEICRRCWTHDPARRPTMHDIIRDLRSEAWFQEERSLKQLVNGDEMSNVRKAL